MEKGKIVIDRINRINKSVTSRPLLLSVSVAFYRVNGLDIDEITAIEARFLRFRYATKETQNLKLDYREEEHRLAISRRVFWLLARNKNIWKFHSLSTDKKTAASNKMISMRTILLDDRSLSFIESSLRSLNNN